MDSQSAFLGTLDAVLDGYEKMRSLVVKMASEERKPEVVLEKVATVVKRASADRASAAVDALVQRGFMAKNDRESMVRTLCQSDPDAICAVIEKFASMAAPLTPVFEDRFEDRDGSSSPSEYSSTSTRSWLEAAKGARKP